MVIIVLGSHLNIRYGILLSRTKSPVLIQIQGEALLCISGKRPTKTSFRLDKSDFLPPCSRSSGKIQKALPICRKMLPIFFMNKSPRYWAEFIASDKAPINTENKIYTWLVEAVTQHPSLTDTSILQLEFQFSTHLPNSDMYHTFLTDLSDACGDGGKIVDLWKTLCQLPAPVPLVEITQPTIATAPIATAITEVPPTTTTTTTTVQQLQQQLVGTQQQPLDPYQQAAVVGMPQVVPPQPLTPVGLTAPLLGAMALANPPSTGQNNQTLQQQQVYPQAVTLQQLQLGL